MGPVVSLAEYSTRKGNLQSLALSCIARLDPSIEHVTDFTVDDSKLSCVCRDSVVYGKLLSFSLDTSSLGNFETVTASIRRAKRLL
jgi:hypothetical protein